MKYAQPYKFSWKGQNYYLVAKGFYMDGTPALLVKMGPDLVPWCTLSVFVDGGAELFSGPRPVAPTTRAAPESTEFLIKSWSENRYTYEFLVQEGILVPTDRRIPTGYVEAILCTVDVSKLIEVPI